MNQLTHPFSLLQTVKNTYDVIRRLPQVPAAYLTSTQVSAPSSSATDPLSKTPTSPN
jgi:hypothetical protein